jgi:hypothetical protein
MLPKEHGSWGMFYIPMALGMLAAGRWSPALVLFFISATAIFLSREALLAFWRARRRSLDPGRPQNVLAVYLLVGLLSGAVLVFVYGLFGLIPLAVASGFVLLLNAEMSIRAQARSLSGEALAIAASVLTAPAAYYVAKREWTVEALILWVLCVAYFLSSVFYVKLRVQTAHAKRPEDRVRARRNCAVYHAILLAALAIAGSWYVLAFAAVLARAFYFLARPTPTLNLKQIGWTEVLYSLIFTVVGAFAVRS